MEHKPEYILKVLNSGSVYYKRRKMIKLSKCVTVLIMMSIMLLTTSLITLILGTSVLTISLSFFIGCIYGIIMITILKRIDKKYRIPVNRNQRYYSEDVVREAVNSKACQDLLKNNTSFKGEIEHP